MKTILNKVTMAVLKDQDVVPFRNKIREYTATIGMSVLNQTKLITAASELVRNMLKYAGGGQASIEIVAREKDQGIRLTFSDRGPGIRDVALAMKDGYSTGKSLGLGLPGTRRLVNEFDIQSEVNKGTTVTIIKWKNG